MDEGNGLLPWPSSDRKSEAGVYMYTADNGLYSEVYIAASTRINKNFGSDLTKEDIKYQLRTWRKQYEILKELLSSDGFIWDRKRKLIIADDSAWNSYIKINPEAKCLRGRTIESYNELCIIIGHASPDVYCAAHGSDLTLALHTNDGSGETTDRILLQTRDQAVRADYILWTIEMDNWLTNVLLEQVKLGNKVGKTFMPVACVAAVSSLNRKFLMSSTKKTLRIG